MAAFERDAELLSSFERLSANAYILEPRAVSAPPAPSNPSAPPDPKVVILCTWNSANPLHVARYIRGYTRLYPSASVVWLTISRADIIYRDDADLQRSIAPLVPLLPTDPDSILLHIFTNDGGLQASRLAQLYHDRYYRPLPARIILFDTAPSQPLDSLTSAYSLPQPATRSKRSSSGFALLPALFHLFVSSELSAILWLMDHLSNHSLNIAKRVAATINDPRLVSKRAKRCYFHPGLQKFLCWDDSGPDTPDEKIHRGKDLGYFSEEAQEQEWDIDRDTVDKRKSDVGTVGAEGTKYWMFVEELWTGRTGAAAAAAAS